MASELITTHEAAERMGISQTQVRRLIRKGKLHAEMELRPQGHRLMVVWDAPHDATPDATPDATKGASTTPPDATLDAPDTRPNATSTPHPSDEDAAGAREQVASLTTEVQWLRERLERSEEAQGELRRMLMYEQQTVATLRAQLPPPSELDAPRTPPTTPPHAPMQETTRPCTLREWIALALRRL